MIHSRTRRRSGIHFQPLLFRCCQFWSIKVLSQKESLYQQKRQFACLTIFRFALLLIMCCFLCFLLMFFSFSCAARTFNFLPMKSSEKLPIHPSLLFQPPHQNERINWFSKGVQQSLRSGFFLQKEVCLFANWKFLAAEKKEGNTNRQCKKHPNSNTTTRVKMLNF